VFIACLYLKGLQPRAGPGSCEPNSSFGSRQSRRALPKYVKIVTLTIAGLAIQGFAVANFAAQKRVSVAPVGNSVERCG
jgi:hypothetical protein